MTVLILDANGMPHGHFSERSLERLRISLGENSSIVVPEVVVWEWAEHAYRAQVALALAVEQHRVDPKIVPRASVSQSPPIDVLIEKIESVLTDMGAEVWIPSSDDLQDAVRQQVLQLGMGEIKRDVKTGAADGLVLACARKYACESEPPVLLLTSDARLRNQAARQIEGLLVANGTRDVLKQLNSFTPAPADLELRAAEVLPDKFNQRIAQGEVALDFNEFGVDLFGTEGEGNPDSEFELQRIDFREVDLVEFHNFEIAHVNESRFGLGEMRIFGQFELAFLERRQASSGAVELLGYTTGLFSMGYVDVTVAIRWDIGWQFEAINATGTAIAVLDDGPEYDEDGDEVPPFRASPGPL